MSVCVACNHTCDGSVCADCARELFAKVEDIESRLASLEEEHDPDARHAPTCECGNCPRHRSAT